MKDKPYLDHRTALTAAEKLRVAVAVLIDGFDQHKVAALMGVNPGRINEAVTAIRQAIEPEEPRGSTTPNDQPKPEIAVKSL